MCNLYSEHACGIYTFLVVSIQYMVRTANGIQRTPPEIRADAQLAHSVILKIRRFLSRKLNRKSELEWTKSCFIGWVLHPRIEAHAAIGLYCGHVGILCADHALLKLISAGLTLSFTFPLHGVIAPVLEKYLLL